MLAPASGDKKIVVAVIKQFWFPVIANMIPASLQEFLFENPACWCMWPRCKDFPKTFGFACTIISKFVDYACCMVKINPPYLLRVHREWNAWWKALCLDISLVPSNKTCIFASRHRSKSRGQSSHGASLERVTICKYATNREKVGPPYILYDHNTIFCEREFMNWVHRVLCRIHGHISVTNLSLAMWSRKWLHSAQGAQPSITS